MAVAIETPAMSGIALESTIKTIEGGFSSSTSKNAASKAAQLPGDAAETFDIPSYVLEL